jgi:hypothetical protein
MAAVKLSFDATALRRTSLAESFPWLGKLVTLVRVCPDGSVTQAKADAGKRTLLGVASDADLVLATWPGEWSQDVFVVDDLRAARLALGLPRRGTKTELSAEPPVAGWSERASYAPPVRLWERLAELADLPIEGQRRIANNGSAKLALLRRSGLDPEARRLVYEGVTEWSAADVAEDEHCTAAEVIRLLDRFPDSARLLEAALCRSDTKELVRRRAQSLSYVEAARLWLRHEPRPALAEALLPVILTKEPAEVAAEAGNWADRYERSSLIESMVKRFPAEWRLELLRDPEHGELIQQALLAGTKIGDEELIACLPEITKRSDSVGETPTLVEHVLQHPRLVDLAKPQLGVAAAQLVVDGWSPTRAAQAGQWDVLVTIARLAEAPELIEELAHAAVFDRTQPDTSGTAVVRWREPRRYEFVDLLVVNSAASDKQIKYILDRLETDHIEDLRETAGKRSQLNRLTTAALHGRQPVELQQSPRRNPTALPVLPTDSELSKTDNPSKALLELFRHRGPHRDAVLAHALASKYMTDDLAWRLPVVDLEQHPSYGPRLARKIADICGDSTARWMEFANSWAQPTQLLATTLFKRLENAEV